jgi:hypothetical protein
MTAPGPARARSPRAAWCRAGALGLLAALTLAGCYRVARPADLEEEVRVVITSNDARLVRAQAYLQQAVAEALVEKLGWRVSPTGSARLALTLQVERISAVGTTPDRDIPSRWSITLRGQALLTARRGNLYSSYTGAGYANGLTGVPGVAGKPGTVSQESYDEAAALHDAAQNAALTIAAWLEGATGAWPATPAAAPAPAPAQPANEAGH